MNYRNHSKRCRHGMCLETVGCEECGIKREPGAGAHLRRATERKLRALPEVPPSYRYQGRVGGTGNQNAKGGA